MIGDFHTHDRRSSDAEGSLEEHARAAAEAGLGLLCVTNHVEVLQPDGSWRVDPTEAIDRLGAGLEEARRLNGRWPGLELRYGAELEYRPGWTSALEEIQDTLPLDFLLGSVHVVDGGNVSGGPQVDAYFEGRGRAETYGRYFETLEEMVSWGRFDAVAHFDLVKRYGHRHYGAYRPAEFEAVIRRVLERMAEGGIGLEINASGWFQAPGAAYPAPEVLRWAREQGVPALTLGTDAHAPSQVGRGLRRALELARETGWTEVSAFRARRAHPLPDDSAAGTP